jgi:translation initiation factor 2B subunit (eIF-2B alpha/beta/delta family)
MTKKLKEYRNEPALAIPEETVQLWKQLIEDSKKRCKTLDELTIYMTEIIKKAVS